MSDERAKSDTNSTYPPKLLPDENQSKDTILAEFDRRCPVYGVKQIMSYVRDPSLYIAGDAWIKRGAMAALISRTGIGKSVFMMQLCICLACGIPILGRIKVHKPVKVLMWQSENDEDVINIHMKSIARQLGVDMELLERNLVIRHAFGCQGMDFAGLIKMDIERFSPDFVAIDHYQSYIDGDMNNAHTFNEWYNPMLELMQQYKFGSMLVCHTPKMKDGGKDEAAYTGVYMSAGSAALGNSVRTASVICHEGDIDSGKYKITFSKSPETAGIRDADGKIVKSLHMEHGNEPGSPIWVVSEDQSNRNRADPLTLLERLLKENPTLTKGEVVAMKAEGLGKTAVYKYWDAAMNTVNRIAKDRQGRQKCVPSKGA